MADKQAIKSLNRRAKRMAERRTNKDIKRLAEQVAAMADYQRVKIQGGNKSQGVSWYITFENVHPKGFVFFASTFPIRGTKSQVFDYLTAMKRGIELKESSNGASLPGR